VESLPSSFGNRPTRQPKQRPILHFRQPLLKPPPKNRFLQTPWCNPGQNHRPNQIPSARLCLPRPMGFAHPPPRLGLLVLLFEPLKPLLESDDLLIQLWHSDGSNRSQF
jgi:hypothetical protein